MTQMLILEAKAFSKLTSILKTDVLMSYEERIIGPKKEESESPLFKDEMSAAVATQYWTLCLFLGRGLDLLAFY